MTTKSKKYYHGTNILFDKFDTSYSSCNGRIYVSPCRTLSMCFASTHPDDVGYLYTVEIDETELTKAEIDDCGCISFADVSNIKIISVEEITYDQIKPIAIAECGKAVTRMQRTKKLKDEKEN